MLTVPLVTDAVPAPDTDDPGSRANVLLPLAKFSVAPEAMVNGPVADPPADRVSVPVCTSTVPELVNDTPIVVVPIPVALRKVPALAKPAAPALLNRLTESFDVAV